MRTVSALSNPWLESAASSESIPLLCLPHAGGSASLYRNWQRFFPPSISVLPVEIPGRGRRLREPLLRSLNELAANFVADIAPILQQPIALFGHSMGALLAFEVARLFVRQGGPVNHLFVAGARAPHLRTLDRCTYDRPDAEFIDELRSMNGTPPELMANSELMEIMLPILRADFEMVQTYEYREGPALYCPITVFGGLQDFDVAAEHLRGWQRYTEATFSSSFVRGDHFFIHTATAEIAARITQQLLNRSRGSL